MPPNSLHLPFDEKRTDGARSGGLVICALLAGVLLSACESTPSRKISQDPVPIMSAEGEIPEPLLMDVGIEVFEPGELSEDEEEELGIPTEVRDAEARFIPVHLKKTMQKTGQWGAVRVVPAGTEGSEVLIRGRIEQSDGEVLDLQIDAYDATGRQWFGKRYRTEIAEAFYNGTEQGVKDAFQDLYNTVANDLAKYKTRLRPDQIENIRRVSEVRFAADLVPDAYGQHIIADTDGIYRIQRLPAVDDPMLARVRNIRERDYLLIDTVNGHYDSFYVEMFEPYANWRRFRSEEAAALRKVKREATNRKLLGAAAIVGAIALEVFGNNETSANTSTLRDVMIIGGALAVKSGFDKGEEAQIHEDALRELGTSFEAEVSPFVVEVEGETVELTGSAEAQYQTWRELLKKIHFSETGLIVPAGTSSSKPGAE
jgi:hypothetical protein